MITSVLVPLDGSSFSEFALPLALAVARPANAVVHLVHVHEEPGGPGYLEALPGYDAAWDGEVREQEEEYLRERAAAVAEQAGLVTRTAVVDGPVVESLAEYASAVGVDVIVMTTHGRGGLSRLWLGSVADGLIRRARLPVLLLRPEDGEAELEGRFEPGEVLVPLDGSELSERVLEHAMALARILEARLALVRVVSPVYTPARPHSPTSVRPDPLALAKRQADAAAYLERVADRLRGRGLDVRTSVVTHAQAAPGILEHARESGAGLVAMATHGRGGWQRVALGSVADKVIRAADIPVLVYRPTPGE